MFFTALTKQLCSVIENTSTDSLVIDARPYIYDRGLTHTRLSCSNVHYACSNLLCMHRCVHVYFPPHPNPTHQF